MPHDLFQRSKELFQNAHDLPQEAHASYLDQACGADEALRAEVEALLAAAREASNFLEHDARSLIVPMLAQEAKVSFAGRQIGPFRLERELGRGGMGVVYLALRDGEFEQEVAIKLIKRGMDTEEIQRRFRHERQTLASLNHPNVARLFDGGITEEGLPYFVMEYVAGRPIDEYCDAHKLDTRERLALFQKVCEAVRYAHQNLIVHRDLKPSNILVNEEGAPKLLDFGIAKLLHQGGTAVTLELTLTGNQPMTPHYASPEQARREVITTASDVYALGVILYELLSGHRPYRFASDSAAEIERVICEVEPEKPSTAIDKTEKFENKEKEPISPESVSAVREGSVEKLRRRLAGDIDNIVLMALRKEPYRRYSSIEQFSDDIRRHLEGLPVRARKGTWAYRASRFVRRHKYAVAATFIFFALVLGFGIVTKVQANRIALERDKAEEVSKFLVEIFQVSDPNEAKGDTITAREILERGAEKITKELKDQPLLQATMMNTMGVVYRNLGLYVPARKLLEESLRIRRLNRESESEDLTTSLNELGLLLSAIGNLPAADSLHREALELAENKFGKKSTPVATAKSNLAIVLRAKGNYKEAERFYREALALQKEILGNGNLEVANTLNNLAHVRYDQSGLAEADSLFRESLALRRKILGDDHLDVAQSYNNLGAVLGEAGRMEEAKV
ncbi:MAG: serine/threonine-protein kinase, partial [candidate division KSB1 bacterium]